MIRYYDTLGLNPASHHIYDIELAYWGLVQQLHPSKNTDEASVAAFYDITMAYFFLMDYEFSRKPSPSQIKQYKQLANKWAQLSWTELMNEPFFKTLSTSAKEPFYIKVVMTVLALVGLILPIIFSAAFQNRFIATILYGVYSSVSIIFFFSKKNDSPIPSFTLRWLHTVVSNNVFMVTSALACVILIYTQITFRTFMAVAAFNWILLGVPLFTFGLLHIGLKTDVKRSAIIAGLFVPLLIQLPFVVNRITAKHIQTIEARFLYAPANTYREVPVQRSSKSIENRIYYTEKKYQTLNAYNGLCIFFNIDPINQKTHIVLYIGEGAAGWPVLLDSEWK